MKTETKHVLPTSVRPGVIEHPGTAEVRDQRPEVRGQHRHHLPTTVPPQRRAVPGLGEDLVKVVEPGKVERRKVRTEGNEEKKGTERTEASQ